MRHPNRGSMRISGMALLYAVLMLLVLPLRWVIAVMVAAVWHELCHMIAVKLCGGTLQSVSIDTEGAVMECVPMKPFREVVCILAGPLGSILLLCFAKWFPVTALCGCCHGLYNLLPVYPLDGGRALKAIMIAYMTPKRAERICLITAYVVMALMVSLALIGAFVYDLGLFPMLLAGTVLFRMKREKLLANFGDRGYNRPTIVKR